MVREHQPPSTVRRACSILVVRRRHRTGSGQRPSGAGHTSSRVLPLTIALALITPAAAPGASAAPDSQPGAPAPPPFPPTEPSTPLPRVDPRLVRAGSADRAVLEWLQAWHRRQVRRMATWSGKRWASSIRGDDPTRVAARYRTHRLLGWLDVPVERTRTRATYVVEIAYRTLLDPSVRRRTLVVPVVRQGPLGLPSPTGRWLVDATRVHDASPLA